MNGLMFIVGMLLIGTYNPRTQFSIRRANVTVICIYPSLSMCLLYWGNPAAAECFCDQTLLTPTVDNPGNSSSSLQLEPHIAKQVRWRWWRQRWWWGAEVTFFPPSSFEDSGVMPAVLQVAALACVFVCIHSEMEKCCSVFKWSISSHFNHKSNNSKLLFSCWPLVIHQLSFFFFSLSILPTSPLYFSPFPHFPPCTLFCISIGINQACSCVAWLHYIIMKFSLRCSQEKG